MTHKTVNIKYVVLFYIAPLVKIRQSIQKLRQETTQMDIRIGVVQHILLQAKLKEKDDQNRMASATDDNYEGFKGF